MKGRPAVEKEAKPGKIRVRSAREHADGGSGVHVRTRIDAETNPAHAAGFLGLRLEAPRTGSEFRPGGGKRRAFVDGPFLESKEVIGG